MYGSSPELEIAMYTVCYYTRRNRNCDFSVDGHNMEIVTFDTTHGGGNHVGTAYVN